MSNAVRGQTLGGVPLGALGYPVTQDPQAWAGGPSGAKIRGPPRPDPRYRRRWDESERMWADRCVLGGYPALLEAKRVVRRSLKRMRQYLVDMEDAQRNAEYWPRYEAGTDEALLDDLALTLKPRLGEDDLAYDGRLREVYASLRVRLDGLAPNGHAAPIVPTPVLPAPPPADVDAPARSTPSSTEESTRDPKKMKRADIKRIRSAFWRRERRLPTRKELTEAYLRGE